MIWESFACFFFNIYPSLVRVFRFFFSWFVVFARFFAFLFSFVFVCSSFFSVFNPVFLFVLVPACFFFSLVFFEVFSGDINVFWFFPSVFRFCACFLH